jgi:protein TonB
MENSRNNVQLDTLEDIIFQYRNKTYGAYILRSEYQNTIKKALLIGISLCCLAILTPMIWANRTIHTKIIVDATVTDVVIQQPPKQETIQPILPPPQKVAQQIKTIAFKKIEIVPDNHETTLPPDQEELSNTDAKIGSKTQDGIVDDIPVDNPDEGNAPEPALPVSVKEVKDDIFLSAEQMPEYQGGVAALSKFLQKNLRYPSTAANNGIGGRVYIQFIVGKDGSINQVDVLRGLGFGCDEEAQRVIKLMPRWNPGKQSGRAVSVKFTLPISFQLSE